MSLIENLEKLRYFSRLTKFSSIRSASQDMGISQAGLSKSIASLEDVLGVKLFFRTNEGLMLTTEGVDVLKATEEIMRTATSLEAMLKTPKSVGELNKFSIGMYDSIAVYFFKNLKDFLSKIYPNIEAELIVDKSSNLKKMVEEHRIDLAIGIDLSLTASSMIDHLPLFDDYYSFFSAEKDCCKIANRALIFHPDAIDNMGIRNEDYLSNLSKGWLKYRVYNMESIKLLASQGFGVGVLPMNVARPFVKKKALYQVRLEKAESQFGKHTIGLLTAQSFYKNNVNLIDDIHKLAQTWSTI